MYDRTINWDQETKKVVLVYTSFESLDPLFDSIAQFVTLTSLANTDYESVV